ncbi:transporter substrate-binding domain-containing protein [Pseudaminobacter sp. NGMCC 1.201702]|uniref:transporter substrate-binding domain-containing protein n=1 Tax=Pseudaminobacter sp. NGMCC 1.201702 TaxID=3391825 RepID=UPI0039F0C782
MNARSILLASIFLGVLACLPVRAAGPEVPVLWDAREQLQKPDLSTLARLRFLTTTDFPPFNFIDANGRLSGFHVDLARAICAELGIADKCQIQALPWGELERALKAGEGEAVIAGIAVTRESREKYAFSRPYLRFPARFIAPKDSVVAEPIFEKLEGKRIGVTQGSAHERLLRDYFPDVRVVTYSKREWMFEDLKAGKIVAVFGDGMRLGFWLAGSEAAGCCRFAGGPYLAPEYLGTGLAIATRIEDETLADAFNYALHQISMKGTFAELYLRYFPVSFY